MDHSPLIADHGLVGDLQTAALVSTDGTVDWFCCPRFDSPSVFGALLDPDGGHCRIRPVRQPYTTRQLYFPDTAILITRFLTESGSGEVIDFMPPASRSRATSGRRLIRMLRCVRGRVAFSVDVVPRFDYGRRPHTTCVTEDGALFDSGKCGLTLHAVREPGDARLAHIHVLEGGVYGSVTLETGQVRGVVLESDAEGPPRAFRVAEIEQAFGDTVRFWRSWLARSAYRGRWRETVHRSAITLKLLTYAPTGAMVAAPTMGLPEQLGGERNWDYRYTWIRDASLSVSSLLTLGFTAEAVDFARWLGERYQQSAHGDDPINVMYRVDGSSDLTEESLAHWAGYRGSSPVRIGNAASGQLQLDVYGELFDTVYQADRRGIEVGHQGWQALSELLGWLTENWDRPEEGIWETREGKADFTYGRLMSWVAFDRGIRLATAHGRPGAVEVWRAHRDRIYDQIWEHGWNPLRQAFVQRYGSDALDASLLRMADVGFIAPQDPRWLATLESIEADLVTDSLVHRYDSGVSPDGLAGSEGTFSLCTFGYVSALARAGYVDKARLVFEKMLTFANHVGLYAEEIGPTGEHLGNFPQAFTHLALIDAALILDRAESVLCGS
ncbi:glycoside hydrolase family 15 protein [Amycolatopsis sp. NPDC058986]|uniref:glycoside hydrolase family 15 protein n=1 Tax=unclassified Amycolatopsis TaxID=2618356 RepID=UPI00366CF465